MRVQNPGGTSVLSSSWPEHPIRGRGRTWFDDFARETLNVGDIPGVYEIDLGGAQTLTTLNARKLRFHSLNGSGNNVLTRMRTVAPVWKINAPQNAAAPVSKMSLYFYYVNNPSADNKVYLGTCVPEAGAQPFGAPCFEVRCINNVAGQQTISLVYIDFLGEDVSTPIANLAANARFHVLMEVWEGTLRAVITEVDTGKEHEASIDLPVISNFGQCLAMQFTSNVNGASCEIDAVAVKWE